MATNASLGTNADPSKVQRSPRGRDGRKATQNDSGCERTNNPPNHGIPTHGIGRFLWEVPKSTPVSELGELYQRWRDDSEQVDFTRWEQ